jgi:hypothetical protein
VNFLTFYTKNYKTPHSLYAFNTHKCTNYDILKLTFNVAQGYRKQMPAGVLKQSHVCCVLIKEKKRFSAEKMRVKRWSRFYVGCRGAPFFHMECMRKRTYKHIETGRELSTRCYRHIYTRTDTTPYTQINSEFSSKTVQNFNPNTYIQRCLHKHAIRNVLIIKYQPKSYKK